MRRIILPWCLYLLIASLVDDDAAGAFTNPSSSIVISTTPSSGDLVDLVVVVARSTSAEGGCRRMTAANGDDDDGVGNSPRRRAPIVPSSRCHVDGGGNGSTSSPRLASDVVDDGVVVPPSPASIRRVDSSSRRRWILSTTCAALSSSVTIFHRPNIAMAAAPLTAEIADDPIARFERTFLRPRPAKVLRPRMNLDFAISLMRSSYNALDGIDIVPMDRFQRDFFLLRQAEYQSYADALGAGMTMQGDLADPNYFDYISFAQYATINRELNDPMTVFEERQPIDDGGGGGGGDDDEPQRFDTVVVRRDASLTKSDLCQKHSQLVGSAILDRLIKTFGNTASALPVIEPGSRPSSSHVLSSIRQMVKLFVISGYAWDGDASMIIDGRTTTGINDDDVVADASGTVFAMTFKSPATLWSGQCLKAKNSILSNDFALKTAREMMHRAGYDTTDASVRYENYNEISTFTVR